MAGEQTGTLTPEQIADFSVRRRQIRERSALGAAQQDYLSQTAKKEGGRQRQDLEIDFARMAEKHPWRFAARGLNYSGIRTHSAGQMAQDFTRNKTFLEDRIADQQRGFTLAKEQLKTVEAGGLADIGAMEQAAKHAAVAQAIRESMGAM